MRNFKMKKLCSKNCTKDNNTKDTENTKHTKNAKHTKNTVNARIGKNIEVSLQKQENTRHKDYQIYQGF